MIHLGQHCTCQISRQDCIRKILCNVVLILLGQHCTDQIPRQHYVGKNPVQCCLNTLGIIFHRLKPYAMLSKIYYMSDIILLCPILYKQIYSKFYPAIGQIYSWMLSKQVKLSANHAMLPKPM